MLEKPNLPDDKIVACLNDHYGLLVTALEFLPIGNDASAWVYRVSSDENIYFLKVKKGTVYEPSVAVPRYLKDQGIEQVVAPLSTDTQQLWAKVDDFALILYPFIHGGTGMEIGMTDRQWMEFGTVLRRIHSTRLSSELLLQVRSEIFSPKWGRVVNELHARIQEHEFDNPSERELASLWKARREAIRKIVDRAKELGHMLQNKSSELVLCHADIHTANILIDHESKLHIVDWDDVLLAPRERDLMFVGGDTDRTREEELFFRGYGKAAIDPVAIAYYRYEWVVQEIGDYGERVFAMKDIGDETRQDAVRGFLQLFQPGDVVEGAYRSEEDLPPNIRVTDAL